MLMFHQNIMKYPMLLEQILKFAKKDDRKNIIVATEKGKFEIKILKFICNILFLFSALDVMQNVVQHVDKFEQDSNYIGTLNQS